MKLTAVLAVAALAGCANLDHGSWLDGVGQPPRSAVAMGDEQALTLAQEAAQLRDRSEAVRARLAREADRRQRFRYYEELRVLGDRLAPVERLLRDAGRPVRSAGLLPPAA